MLCSSWEGTDTGQGNQRGTAPGEKPQPELVPVPAHLHHVHASLEPGRALEIPRAPQVLKPGERGQGK